MASDASSTGLREAAKSKSNGDMGWRTGDGREAVLERWRGSVCPVPRGANRAPGLRSDAFLSSNTSSNHAKAALTSHGVSRRRPECFRPSVFGVRM